MYFQFNKNDTSTNIFCCCYNEINLFPQTHTTNARAIFQYNIRRGFGDMTMTCILRERAPKTQTIF